MVVRALLCGIALILGARPALAQERRVMVIPVAGELANRASLTAELTKVMAAARKVDGATIEISNAELADVLTLAGCTSTQTNCLQQLLGMVSVDEMIFSEIAVEGSKLRATVTWVRKGEGVATKSADIAGTDDEAIRGEFSALVGEVFGTTEPEPEPPPVEPEPPPPAPEPEPQPQPPPPVVTHETDSGFSLGKAGFGAWTTTVAGAVLAGTGATLLAIASGRQSEIDDQPTASVEDLDRLEELEDSAERLELFGNALLVTGAVTAAVGVTLVIVQANSTRSKPAVSVSPMPMPGGAGVSVTIRGLP